MPRFYRSPQFLHGLTVRQKWFGAGLILLVLLALSGLLWSREAHPIQKYVRSSLERIARERAGADARIATLEIEMFPHFQVSGHGLVIIRQNSNGAPPLISIHDFYLKAGLLGLLMKHFQELKLDGMEINVPPKNAQGKREAISSNSGVGGRSGDKSQHLSALNFSIGEIIATHTTLNILHEDDTPGLTFAIHGLRMARFQPDTPVEYFATLTNAKPSGEIQTHGRFGPWNKDQPGQTPVAGTYLFSHANLGELKGISGTLSSQGEFQGVLDYLEVNGHTQTPDFALDIAHHKIPLNTEFHAIVDGTNGNTILEPIRFQLGSSSFVAKGEIAKLPNECGREISLAVETQDARLQDLLRLAVKSKSPVLAGKLALTTSFTLPSRRSDSRSITDRLQLAGVFHAKRARFSRDLQTKINALSRKGKGAPNDPSDSAALSNFGGHFKIGDGAIHFSRLAFGVPGAKVNLHGGYNLDSEQLDFQGTLRLDAKLSQTTTGWKSLLLKPIDPLFEKKEAGAVLPITISGTRENPSFKLDFRRIFARDVFF